MREYIGQQNEKNFNINYSLLAQCINEKVKQNTVLMKTYLFAYRPCDELMKLTKHQQYYAWLSGIKNKPYFEVIEGTQEIRTINANTKIDIKNESTYRTEEKGTDINLAVNMLSKGYQNAYDVAILVSGDTDYIPVIRELHHLGKIVILASLPNQNIKKYDEYRDAHITIDMELLKKCSSLKK